MSKSGLRFAKRRGVVTFALSFVLSLAAIANNYDDLFQKGLEAENAENFAAAIQYYIEAGKANPNAPWTEQRIAAIFKRLQEKGESLATYEILIPVEMKEKFLRTGVILSNYDGAGALKKLNFLIWGGIFFVIAIVLGIFIYFVLQKKSDEEEDRLLNLRKSPLSKRTAQASSSTEAVGRTSAVSPKKESKKDAVITEKTREGISDIFSSVTSIKSVDENAKKEEAVDVEALRDSGIVAAFAQSMVSEVATEESSTGKFSKMTVEASLLFEDEMSADPEIEKKEGDPSP